MTSKSLAPTRRHAALRTLAAGLCAAALSTATVASPGAHGPNGEHLDAPTTSAGAASGGPRVEAHSELFELAAGLEHGVFAFFIGRYASSEPVLGATVEVESGPRKASAAFRPEQGDYVVQDPAFLGELAGAGAHALLFTVSAGADSDLLEGTLQVAAPAGASAAGGGGFPAGAVWFPAGALGLAAAWVAWSRHQARPRVAGNGGTRA